jgi:cation diffusion facilitator family transporter
VTWAGLAINIVLAALKVAGGLIGSSQAVVADGVHSLSDTGTDVAILLGVGVWARPADPSHPHGHRRIETLVTNGIGIVLMLAGVGIAYHAVLTLQQAHAHPPGWVALGAAVLSVLAKESLYQWTARVGKRIKSSAVVANAWHHRSDAISSVPVVLAVLGARILPSWYFLDHLASVVVSVFILRTGWRVFWPAVKELVDVGASRREVARIRKIAMETPRVRQVLRIRTRYVGGSLMVDLHVLVDEQMTVREGHDVAEKVQERLLASGPDVVDAVVHLEPVQDGGGPAAAEQGSRP